MAVIAGSVNQRGQARGRVRGRGGGEGAGGTRPPRPLTILLAPMGATERRELLEVIEDRHGNRPTVIAGQLPVKQWHAYIGEPTVADSICDRLVHGAHRIELQGESMRKRRAALTKEDISDK